MIFAASAAAIVCYVAALLIQWRLLNSYQPDSPELAVTNTSAASAAHLPLPASPYPSPPAPNRMTYGLAVVGLVCHAFACYKLVLAEEGINLDLIAVSNLVSFFMLLMVSGAGLRLPVVNLNLFIYPLAVLFLVMALLFPPSGTGYTDIDGYLATHILVSLGAYAMLMMAAFQSGLLATQEKYLRSRSFGVLKILPPLEYMEQLLVTMLWVGLVLLTASIATGFAFLDVSSAVAHHFVLTSASWLTYATFLGGRYLFGWRGLTAVRWTTTAFILLLLGYLGSKFVLEYLLS
ncbi:MAG: cytochrome c biogenesis protein CcsA [Pseudomonadota bacterium]